jgi:GR25 family glycosyltransferase involved in LPS biosynthesis
MDIEARVIRIKDNEISEKGAEICIHSSKTLENDIRIDKFDAVTPDEVGVGLIDYMIEWNYPWQGEVFDIATGLKKTAYRTSNPAARIACALSHYKLWRQCAGSVKPFLILEHDAVFINKLDDNILWSNHQIIGINNPLYATRKAKEFMEIASKGKDTIVPVPTVDSVNVPQGLAGNSAYIIKPDGAKQMLKLVKQYGLWPNDALMCKQLVKGMGVTRKFYTRVQGLPSTTT